MTSNFEFTTDARAKKSCTDIVLTMIDRFGIDEEEAIERINRDWHDQGIVGDDVVYHETPEHWAYTIYYGKDSLWWISLEGLLPRRIP